MPAIEEQTVYVVDDNPNICVTMKSFLQAAGLKVESYHSAKAFLADYRHTPGCLVVDMQMPEMSGVELIEHLATTGAPLYFIVVSGESDVADAVRAMKLGTFEFIEKPCSPHVLLERIREALALENSSRHERQWTNERKLLYGKLTERERRILLHVLAGKQSKLIADELGVSVSTIDNHRARIMKKLKAETAADLARIAMLVDPSLAFLPKK